MADILSPAARSERMSRIRGRGNASTEERMRMLLRSAGLSGWRRHCKLSGRPDFVFRQEKVAIFVDGCFWHGCPTHFKAPVGNAEFWRKKIAGNRERDRAVNRNLRKAGWTVLRIWEHALHSKKRVATTASIKRALIRASQ